MFNLIKSKGMTTFIIQHEDWTEQDTDDLKTLLSFPKFKSLVKLVHKRMNTRTEELVNGKETKDRIDELKDLLLELQNYGNT